MIMKAVQVLTTEPPQHLSVSLSSLALPSAPLILFGLSGTSWGLSQHTHMHTNTVKHTNKPFLTTTSKPPDLSFLFHTDDVLPN